MMFQEYRIMNVSCIVVLIFFYFNQPVSALYCWDCISTFPSSSICLPTCSQSYIDNSTCLLTRNIPLVPTDVGSLRAGHINQEPIISDATEKNFVFGEEAVYQNPSEAVGWDWEYGPVTYGCDTPGCNSPENVNRIPNALNARIPDETLNRLLTGDLDNTCYRCDLCLDESITGANMSYCDITPCPNHACNFVATRASTTGPSQCDGGWHFSSNCILSREPAQVDMTLMYYIRSNSIVVYQMEAVCLSDNCNNFTTFKQLKDAITVNPDLSCLINGSTPVTVTPTTPGTRTSTSVGTGSTTTPSRSTTLSTTSGGTTGTATSTGSMGTTTSGGAQTTSRGSTGSPSTTARSSSEQIFLNIKLFILIIFFLFI